MKSEKQFRNRAIVIEKGKCGINFNKPIYTRTGTSDLRKVLMKDSNYNYIKHKYGGKAEMFLTDADV